MSASSIFELTIQSTTNVDSYRLVAEFIRPGELPIRRECQFDLNIEQLPAQIDPARYGKVLGKLVFSDGVRELFAQARTADVLQVLLAVEARALQTLRWERLAAPFDGDRWQLLGQSQRTPFSLYLPSASDRRFPPFGRAELKALVVVANPTKDNRFELSPFDEAHAIDTVLTGLGEIPSQILGKDPRAVGPPTVTELLRQLTAERYTLLHMVGHGAFSAATGETAVFLDGKDGQPRLVKASPMIERLRDLGSHHGLPHLTFLAVCDSAKPEAEGVLGGLGQRLVRELGMPTVVAMTERVSQETALTLGTELYSRLAEHGEVDRALVEACVAVRENCDMVVPALFSRLVGRPLFSDVLERPLTPAQLCAAAERLDTIFEQRAPTLREQAKTLAEAVAVDFTMLTGDAKKQHEHQLTELEQLCDSALELSFSTLARGTEPPHYGVRCPFPGLQAFTADEREFFCGRAPLVEALLGKLALQPFLAVLGNSGSGKSSLIMAGVLPRLQDVLPSLQVVQMRPGYNPLAELDRVLPEVGEASQVALYVDQFEEVFTLCEDEEERMAFFDRLLRMATPTFRVIMSMRADFIGDCAKHERLREQVEGLKLIPPMSPDELRNAIEEQGKAAGLRYETGLCELILEDIAKEPGAMPLLQHALLELYARRHGRWLRVQAYEELGRVQMAITQTAEGVWESLEFDDRQRLRSVMLELAEIRGEQADGAIRYVRRRVALVDLYFGEPHEKASVRRLVDRLANERLLVKSRDKSTNDVVEVAHEALLRGWKRMQVWLRDSRDALRLRQELELSANAWHWNPDSRSYLEHVHERGELVRSFLRSGALRLGPRIRAYFEACEAEERRQASEKEQQIMELRRARDEALAERDRARDATWMAYVRTFKDKDPTRALLGLREVKVKDTAGWLQDALDVLQKPVARALLIGHQMEITSACFSPDGRRIVTTSNDGTARVWNADGREEPVVLGGHQGEVHSAAFDAEGQRIVTVSTDGTARIWNADGRGEALVLEGHDKHIVSAEFSPDGRRIVTASRDKTARVWNTVGNDSVVVLRGHAGHVVSASFSPDGQRIVTASRDKTARVWNAEGSGEAVVLAGHKGHLLSASFSPDSQRIVTASRDKTARIWSAKDGETEVVLRGHEEQVRSASFSADGERVVTTSHDGTTRLWPADGSTDPLVFACHQSRASSASLSPGGRRIVTTAEDGAAQVWNSDGSGEPTVLLGHEDEVVSVAFSPDGLLLATASRDRVARVWSKGGAQVPLILAGHEQGVQSATFGPKGRLVVTASRDGTARVWNTGDNEPPVVLRGHEGWVVSASISPRGQHVVTASADGTVRLWNTEGDDSIVVLRGHEKMIVSAAFSPDGQRIVTALSDGTARVWNSGSGEVAVLNGHQGEVASAQFSPDGQLIVTASADGTARIWGTDGGGQPQILSGHDGGISSVTFSPDGRFLVTTSRDQTARVWRTDGSGAPVILRGHDDAIISAAFDPEGQRVVTASRDRTARVWNANGRGDPVILRGHGYLVGSAMFSPNGQRIITASYDSTARVWSPDGRGTPLVLRGHEMGVVAACYSPDGRRVVTASSDGTARVWTLDPKVLEELLETTSSASIPVQDRIQYLGESYEQAHSASRPRKKRRRAPPRAYRRPDPWSL
ncbi:MAG: CHAT domain-containing protein [Myxococcota bacterium]